MDATLTAPAKAPHEDRASTATAVAGLVGALGAAVVLMISAAGTADGWRIAAALVFSLSLVTLHLASTLYHAATDPVRKARLKVFDHCAIYVLIAGTYTPFTLIGLRGQLGWTLFIAIWSLAALGIVFKLFTAGRLRLLSTAIYVVMGWLVVLAIKPVYAALDAWTFGWLVAGGVVYTAGTWFYHRPSLRNAHAIWHLFVIGGSACHCVAVYAQLTSPA